MMLENFHTKTGDFLAWLPVAGINISPSVGIKDFRPSRGRGLVAKQNLKEDEVIFSIPRPAVLSLATAAEYLDTTTMKALHSMPSWLSLTAILLCEARKNDSRWSPYLSILPNTLNSLVFWTESELSELQASSVLQKIGKNAAEDLFSQYISPLGLENSSMESCHLAASIIMAYAFDVPQICSGDEGRSSDDEKNGLELVSDDGKESTVLSMVPLADILNADADKNNARLCCDNQDLEMRTIKTINAGEEIFNDYGALPQSDLLRRYGYVSDRYAQYNVVEISTQLILSVFSEKEPLKLQNGQHLAPISSEEINKRVCLAMRENVYEESYDISHSDPEGPSIPEELLALLYLLLIDCATLAAIETSRDSLPTSCKLATQTVGLVLIAVLKKREEEYATTMEEDEELLKLSDLVSTRRIMAVKVRLGEKRVMREAIQTAASFSAMNQRMKARNHAGGEKYPQTGLDRRDQEDTQPLKKKARYR